MTLLSVAAQASMSGSNTPAVLLLCLALTLGALFYTLYLPGELLEAPEKSRLSFLRERKEAVYENLRDLNFEYKAGKFPEPDYRQMSASLEEEAAALLAEIQELEASKEQVTRREQAELSRESRLVQ
jgi:hypothetical protein